MKNQKKTNHIKPGLKKVGIYLTAVLFAFAILAASASAEPWQQVLETAFCPPGGDDPFCRVDTFDHYNDWYPYESTGPVYTDTGQVGIFEAYKDYTSQDRCPDDITYTKAITDHGSNKQVGTKGLKLSHSNGASLFGTYFGDGRPDSGYSEMYVFFRIYIPRSSFPTFVHKPVQGACPEDVYDYVGYNNGDPYLYSTSGKFVNINTGYTSHEDGTWGGVDYDNPNVGDYQYGCSEYWFHLKGDNTSGDDVRIRFGSRVDGAWGSRRQDHPIKIINKENYLDKLVAIEMRFKLEDPIGAPNGLAQLWIYDEDGNKTLLNDEQDVIYRNVEHCAGQLFNRIRFEGNKHMINEGLYIYRTDSSMDASYYVDDFILDDQPIGDKYFALINNQPLPLTVSFTASPNPARINEQITFSASASADNISSFQWDFDNDGTTDATGAQVTHTFPAAGTYPVKLTAENGEETASTTEFITVNQGDDAGSDNSPGTGDTGADTGDDGSGGCFIDSII